MTYGAWLVGASAIVIAAGWAAGFVAAVCAARKAVPDTHSGVAYALRDSEPAFRLNALRGFSPLTPAAERIASATPDLEKALGQMLGGRQGAVYRLGRVVSDQGCAQAEATFDGNTRVLQAECISGGDQLWRLLPSSETAPRLADVADPLLQTSDPRFLDDLPVAVARLDATGHVQVINAAARRLLGAEAEVGARISDLLEGLGKTLPDRIRDTVAGRAQGRSEVARGRSDDGDGFFQVTMSRLERSEDKAPELIAVFSDATELKTLEAQFVQSQKMQAVGQLAGGIAHDFNNLLTAINGHCDLLLLRHLQGDADHADLIQVRQNANRAAALVRQLLAFSRKQTLRPQVLSMTPYQNWRTY